MCFWWFSYFISSFLCQNTNRCIIFIKFLSPYCGSTSFTADLIWFSIFSYTFIDFISTSIFRVDYWYRFRNYFWIVYDRFFFYDDRINSYFRPPICKLCKICKITKIRVEKNNKSSTSVLCLLQDRNKIENTARSNQYK